MKRIASLAVALLATLILVGSVSAAKPTDLISLDQANPSNGDTITFTTSGGNFIEVKCYSKHPWDNRNRVYGRGLPTGSAFTLDFSQSGVPYAGSATCEAELLNFTETGREVLDSVRFTVSA